MCCHWHGELLKAELISLKLLRCLEEATKNAHVFAFYSINPTPRRVKFVEFKIEYRPVTEASGWFLHAAWHVACKLWDIELHHRRCQTLWNALTCDEGTEERGGERNRKTRERQTEFVSPGRKRLTHNRWHRSDTHKKHTLIWLKVAHRFRSKQSFWIWCSLEQFSNVQCCTWQTTKQKNLMKEKAQFTPFVIRHMVWLIKIS